MPVLNSSYDLIEKIEIDQRHPGAEEQAGRGHEPQKRNPKARGCGGPEPQEVKPPCQGDMES